VIKESALREEGGKVTVSSQKKSERSLKQKLVRLQENSWVGKSLRHRPHTFGQDHGRKMGLNQSEVGIAEPWVALGSSCYNIGRREEEEWRFAWGGRECQKGKPKQKKSSVYGMALPWRKGSVRWHARLKAWLKDECSEF